MLGAFSAAAGVTLVTPPQRAPARLADAPIAMECVLHQVLQFGRSGSEYLVGEVRLFPFREGVCVGGRIDSERLRPIGRLAGPTYSKLGEVVVMRPNRAIDGGEIV
jgi:flavin reductase (DIM6/NTAB) family NADH-FMN oxidoreductase RutF